MGITFSHWGKGGQGKGLTKAEGRRQRAFIKERQRDLRPQLLPATGILKVGEFSALTHEQSLLWLVKKAS